MRGGCGTGHGWGGVVPSRVWRRGSTHPVVGDWYCQGPTVARIPVICVHQGTPARCTGFRTPWLLALRYRPQDQYRRDSTINILKLVNIRECHHNCSMRPAILPVSKTGLKVTTLNSQISNISSLLSQGINGPVFDLEGDLSSKRQSVVRCAPLVDPGDGHIPPPHWHCQHGSSCSLAARLNNSV